MNPASIVLLALAMSTDAFAAAVGKGAALHRPRFAEALRTGVIFGCIEGATPVLGWLAGAAAANYVAAWDHWIAFVVLGALGGRMIHAGLSSPQPQDGDDEPAARPGRHSFWSLAVTGFATSIDALAVGAGLAFVDVDIVPVAAAIGVATTLMVTTGVLLGRAFGVLLGRRAEIAGGIVLIGIGALILHQHLSGAA